MGTKNNPSKFDCYEKAAPDEPMFILLARDKTAPTVVRIWANIRGFYSRKDNDTLKVKEAKLCAKAMERWRKKEIK